MGDGGNFASSWFRKESSQCSLLINRALRHECIFLLSGPLEAKLYDPSIYQKPKMEIGDIGARWPKYTELLRKAIQNS